MVDYLVQGANISSYGAFYLQEIVSRAMITIFTAQLVEALMRGLNITP